MDCLNVVDLSARTSAPGPGRAGLAGMLLVTVLLAAAYACGDYEMFNVQPGENAGAGGEFPVEPRMILAVTRTTDLGPLRESPLIVGRDGAISGEFAGRSVWLFGDTTFHKDDSLSIKSNTWAWTTDMDAANGIDLSFPISGGEPAPLLEETEAEHQFNAVQASQPCDEKPCGARWALWPQAIIADPARERALVFYAKMYVEAWPFDFWSAGQSIAIWKKFEQAPDRRIDPATGDPPFVFAESEFAFTSARTLEGDRIYAYGCETVGYRKECRVARAPIEDALDSEAWRYYSGPKGWSRNVSEAVVVMDGNDIMSVAYNRYLRAYLATYSPPLTDLVVMRTAPRPEGPWSNPVEAFAALPPAVLWVYDAQAHPDFEGDGGQVQYVTYTHATSAKTSEVRLVEVDLGRYDATRVAALVR